MDIRGYGPVKAVAAERVKAQVAKLLSDLRIDENESNRASSNKPTMPRLAPLINSTPP
jgi:hypothetical protein